MAKSLLLGAALILLSSMPPTSLTGLIEAEPRIASPAVEIVGGTANQRTRMTEALGRFDAAGLSLPDLSVSFHEEHKGCGGHRGYFERTENGWAVDICSDEVQAVYEHELAHAWISSRVGERVRHSFLELLCYSNWNDSSADWKDRGLEAAAVIVQREVSGLPLPPALSAKTKRELVAYRLLTGSDSPRLERWLRDKAVLLGSDSETPILDLDYPIGNC